MNKNDTNTEDFDTAIEPFFWVEHDGSVSVCLDAGEYKSEVFRSREDEGFEGSGYDWSSLARVFLNEREPGLAGLVDFDSEASMFCAYSSNADALKSFILSFRKACDDDALLRDLLSRAELD